MRSAAVGCPIQDIKSYYILYFIINACQVKYNLPGDTPVNGKDKLCLDGTISANHQPLLFHFCPSW